MIDELDTMPTDVLYLLAVQVIWRHRDKPARYTAMTAFTNALISAESHAEIANLCIAEIRRLTAQIYPPGGNCEQAIPA
jgi:hypothetical protein